MSTAIGSVVGRDEELAALREFATAVDGPSALVLEGEAGIGKTTLWREGVAAARNRSGRVLTSRPAGAEAGLSFAALADLLVEVIHEVLPELPVPQRRALQVALLLEEPSGRPPDQRAVGAAFLGVLRTLARAGPVLVAIDDVQWLDLPSAAVLEFAVRRLGAEPVGFLLALRLDGSEEVPLRLDRALREERLHRIRLGPLSLGALHHLLRERLGVSFPRPVLRRIWETSGGNPFYALELGRALQRRRAQLELGEPLPLPRTLQELVRERLAGLPPRVEDVLRLVAGLSNPTVLLIEAAAAEEDGTAGALDATLEAGLLELDGERVRFTHPLLASGVYSALGPEARRALHRRLASVAAEPEERARHLALAASGPDAEVANALEKAATSAYSRGAPDAAAELSEQARRLTPKGRPEDVNRRSIAAADYHYEAGATVRARALLEEVVSASPPGPARASALLRLANVCGEIEGLPASAELYAEALREADDIPSLQAAIHQKLAWKVSIMGDTRGAEEHARLAVEMAERLGDPALLAQALAALGWVEVLLGRGIPVETMSRALALEEAAGYLYIDECPSTVLGLQLMFVDDLDGARAKLDATYKLVLQRGDETGLNIPLSSI